MLLRVDLEPGDDMKLLGSAFLMFTLALPATAQTVKTADLVGTWQRDVIIPSSRMRGLWGVDDSLAIGRLTLRADSLWWEVIRDDDDSTAIEGTGYTTGRWRLANDTLWLVRSPAVDEGFNIWGGEQLSASLGRKADTVTTKPKPEPKYWDNAKLIAGYKVILTGGSLSLTRSHKTDVIREGDENPVTEYIAVKRSAP